jgi:DNA-nicking Smr family endonuclease
VTSRRGKTPDDATLWQRVAEGIAPLPAKAKRKTAKIARPAPPAKPEQPAKPVKPVKAKLPPAKPAPPPLPPLAHGLAPGLDAASLERLRRGKMPIEAKLDLHGFTLEAAHKALADFVARSAERERRALLVITGKGGRAAGDGETPRGTLRESVPRWLNEPALRSKILAFAQAQPKHGGAGALYVLLKRKR